VLLFEVNATPKDHGAIDSCERGRSGSAWRLSRRTPSARGWPEFLFGVAPRDPAVFIGVSIVLGLVASKLYGFRLDAPVDSNPWSLWARLMGPPAEDSDYSP
jgi:hypothetical protein